MHFRIKRYLFVAPIKIKCCTMSCSQRFTDYAARSGMGVELQEPEFELAG